MKRNILFLLVLFLLCVCVTLLYVVYVNHNKPHTLVSGAVDPNINGSLSYGEYAIPSKLIIHKIALAADVERVGLDKKGNMDIPSNNDNVAWYQLGYKLGEKGNTVLAGHYDTATGAPAIFWNLSEIQPGDEIIVQSSTGYEYTYEAIHTKSYPVTAFPLQEIFGPHEENLLRLITCEGQYTEGKGYSNRSVTTARLR